MTRRLPVFRIGVVLVATLAIQAGTASYASAGEAAITKYGEKHPQAPEELEVFSFLVGKWNGGGRTRLWDGRHVRWEGATWIGRYILNGTAIADEFHSLTPDGKSYLGVSLRQFDAKQGSWIVEYLNVSNSFLRRQVNPRSGSVSADGGSIVILSEDGETTIREHYRVKGRNHFSYRIDMSADGGRTWGPVLIEMTMTRVE